MYCVLCTTHEALPNARIQLNDGRASDFFSRASPPPALGNCSVRAGRASRGPWGHARHRRTARAGGCRRRSQLHRICTTLPTLEALPNFARDGDAVFEAIKRPDEWYHRTTRAQDRWPARAALWTNHRRMQEDLPCYYGTRWVSIRLENKPAAALPTRPGHATLVPPPPAPPGQRGFYSHVWSMEKPEPLGLRRLTSLGGGAKLQIMGYAREQRFGASQPSSEGTRTEDATQPRVEARLKKKNRVPDVAHSSSRRRMYQTPRQTKP